MSPGVATASPGDRTGVRQGSTSSAPEGEWIPYTPATGGDSSAAPSAIADPNVLQPPPSGTSCPSAYTGYTGSQSKWNCLSITKDGSGHNVWLRIGYTGGFGWLHAYNDHNLDSGPIETTISQNAHGTLQTNGRYFYAEYYRRPDGTVAEWVKVIEQRTPGNGSPDSQDLGVVTAFCTSSPTGSEPTTKCPNWVNATL